MAEMVGSALLSGLFNVLFDRLATEEVKNFLRPKKVIKKLLEKLEVSLLSANKLLDVAEEKQIKYVMVKKWHNELKDVVCKADELADKIETEVLRLQMEENQSASESSFYEDLTNMFTTLLSNPLSSFDNYVKDELEEILSSLEHLLSQKDALGLEPAGKSNYSGVKTRVSERSRPTPFVRESDFCGREGIKETIMQSLRSAEVGGDKVSVIPVIGAGGLGKTTLVQIIYDHTEVQQLFGEVRAWVTVSTEFDLPAITKVIIRKVSSSSRINGDEDQKELLDKLRDALTGKKILLVLDDVWSENHRVKWESLKSCFMSGSKIIVTTRSRKVASIMAPNQQHHFLQELPEKDCLKLFAQTVFGDDEDPDAYPDLQEIGKKIVYKCKGNPLSVRSVGGILCGGRNPEKWEKILESSLWELLQEDNEDIIPSLWLSYLYLPSEIKPCFAYCSIFPKDYLFKKEEVVQLWMAEGFLKNEAGKRGITMEEVGKQYIEELISRSLFQSCYADQYLIMHDLVHDLAMNVSGEFCFCLEGEKNLRDLSCKTRYLSWNMEIQDVKIFEGLSKAKRLHSFVVLRRSIQTGDDMKKVLEALAIEGGCLRVLSLSPRCTMESLPDSIGNLMHLRYLNLSWTEFEKLPDSVGTLYSLQTLLLSGCLKLTQLPDSIGDLMHMRYLNLSETGLEKLPDSVGTLDRLETLLLSSCLKLTQLPDSIGDLKHLRDLDLSETELEKLPDSVGTLDRLETLLLSSCLKLTQLPDSIGNLKHLRDLNLSSSGLEKLPDSVGTLDRLETLLLSSCLKLTQLPDSIGDLKHLRNLNLSETGLEKLPDSVGTLDRLERLLLSSCLKLTQLPDSIGDLKHLRDLNLSKTRLEKLPDSVGTLDRLETLLLSNCLKLTQLPDSIGDLKHLRNLNLSSSGVEKLPDSVGTLYSLQTLLISGCLKLTHLPDSIGNLKHLRDLNLSSSGVEKLPDSVGTLYNLQTLRLSNCRKLTQLPSNLGRLINLHHLDTRDSSLEEMPPHMCNLKKLQTLTEFVEGKHGSSIRDLGALHDLSELGISRLQNVDDVLKGNLEDKKNLRKLVLVWEKDWVDIDDSRGSRKQNTVLVSLQPHANLKELSITGYGGTSFPDWVLSSKVEMMSLVGCGNCFSLPSLGRLASLRDLRMHGFPRLETIGGDGSVMPSLEILHFENMREWKRWSVIEAPRLKELKLKNCPKLVGGLPNSNTIRILVIDRCESLVFPENHLYPSLENLEIKQSCGSIKRLSLEHLPKLNKVTLNGLQCLVELTGESPNVLEWLSIEECPRLEFMGNGCYGSLKNLKISMCEALESIPLDNFPKLKELDLVELQCLVELTGESPNELERLSIEECPELEFMGNGCYGSLKSLEIWKCKALEPIPLDYFPKLNLFTLSMCKNFEWFRFAEEPPLVLESLTYLGLEGLPKFVSFPEGGLPAPNLEKLRISDCKNLRSLPQQMHRLLPSLKRLKVMDCEEIEWWPEGGLPSELESLKIWGCKKLAAQVMRWDLQTLAPCLKKLGIDGCGEELLDSFPSEGLLHTFLTSLDIMYFQGLKTLNIHAFQNLEKLIVENCHELQCLPEESLPNSLVELSIYNCPLLQRRYRKETGEGWPKISHIPQVWINDEEQHEDQQT